MSRSLEYSTRREFLAAAATVVAGLTVPGCGDEEGGGDEIECPEITIANNHGHILEIPIEDIEAGETKTYTLEGTHEHTLEIDMLVFEKLESDGEHTVTTSTTDGHAHQITLVVDPSCLPEG